jgi:CHAT domain-containing protein
LGQLAEVRRLIAQRKALAPDETSLLESVLKTLETRSLPQDLDSPEALEQRIRQFRQAGDRTNTATSLESLATMELNRGQLRRGLAHYQEALALFEQLGMRGRAASTLRSIGQTLATLGDYGRSLEVTGRALELARAVGEDTVQTQCLLDLADLQQTLGSLEQAGSSFEAALSLASNRRDYFRQAQALTGLADLRRREQKLQEAAALAAKALATARASQMPLLETSALSTLVRVHESLGELEPALQAAQRIQAISHRTGDRWIGATGDALLGRVLLAMGRPSDALDALSKGLTVFRAQQQIPALTATLDLQARALTALGRLAPAIEAYREEERLCAEMGDRRCQADVLFQQSRLTARQGQLEAALEQIKRSLSITENLRSSLPSTDLRQSYFAQVQDHYDWCIEVLLQLHRRQPQRRFDRQALEVSERARARGLVELLTAAHAESSTGIDPALLKRRRTLDSRIRELLAGRLRLRQSAQTGEDGAPALADLDVRLAELQRQQQHLEQELRRSSPRYADLLLPQTLDTAGIQALLDDETLLLELHLGETQSVLWLIDRRGVDTFALTGRAEIQALVSRFHAERYHAEADPSPAAAALSRLLLDPLAARLGSRRLAMVPHGSLFYFPFAALPSSGNGQPLVDTHELVSLPSASTLAALRRGPSAPANQTASLLVLADPVFSATDPRLAPSGPAGMPAGPVPIVRDGEGSAWQRLPGTAMEAEAISTSMPPGSNQRRQEGFAANRQILLAMDLRPYRWVHIATHGQADGAHPERSRLVLSLLNRDGQPIDGNLRLQDIYNLQLAADLVVLSACQSGLGPVVRGEGLVSLTRGFLYAGSKRVLASLWNVDDHSTAILMGKVYRSLMVERLTPAAALRQAQRQLLADPRWRSANHWAAFTLYGDWR